MGDQSLIFRGLHILFELIAFICALVGVCDDKHDGCRFSTSWAFAFSVSVISLFWWILLILQDKLKCFSWSGMSTLEKIMWFILYHFVYAAAIITISNGKNSAKIAANCFWWFDLILFFFEAALMANLFDNVQIKGITDQGAPNSNVQVSKK
ncbi:Oidioi.mRNA.OKI2018_I69.chr2.g4615.t1.cds [Oikopleura dioica]|uniref:Oidioi.mRNA.OKI2018_I69.chr2.g4615.t1.cds n=1 Tax=Oikopleura dioica TaxID=34765 RepID=A0ABN7SXW6_OIKDI|nr:Oidioi.mRNA.OKI2018_I69.chr2.g4615.t1.cds [Oikopleura dioica]